MILTKQHIDLFPNITKKKKQKITRDILIEIYSLIYTNTVKSSIDYDQTIYRNVHLIILFECVLHKALILYMQLNR